MADSQTAVQSIRGFQQSLLPPLALDSMPAEPRGAVYTKRWVVELLLDLAGYKANANLVDAVAVEPAAGDGAFLGPMIERLLDSCQHLGRTISGCLDAIVAYEINEISAEQARSLAVKTLIRRGVNDATAEKLARTWVRTGDYLFETNITADFVIGNPPYVRLEHIPDAAAHAYRRTYSTMYGRADLYIAFFEAALRQLRDGGTCAFICADRWMRNQYGAALRELITSEFSMDIIVEMHNADAFHGEVDAYPAVTIIRRKAQGAAIVASAVTEAECVLSEDITAISTTDGPARMMALQKGLRAARVDTWFKGSAPWPCRSPEQLALLRRLEEEFSPLEISAKVGIGVATGNDKVFVTTNVQLVERSRLLKLALAKDLSGGSLNWSGHYLVNPWDRDGLVRLDQYPRLHSYLNANQEALKKRHTAIKSTHAWYKTIDRVNHHLTRTPKLYIADIKNALEPVLDNGETYPHHNLYYICSDKWNLETLGGLLMSVVGHFFVESYGVRMRGGYLRFQAQYLRRICVPPPDSLSKEHVYALGKAFRSRDRERANQIALEVYNISSDEMERALGH